MKAAKANESKSQGHTYNMPKLSCTTTVNVIAEKPMYTSTTVVLDDQKKKKGRYQRSWIMHVRAASVRHGGLSSLTQESLYQL